MPQPEGSQLNFGFSPILTNVGVNLLPKLDQFIGRRVFPKVSVASPTGKYNIWTPGDFLRRNGKEIANGEPVPLAGFATGQGNYSMKNWGLGTAYTARDLADARRGGMTDQAFKNAKARFLITQGLLEIEFRVKTLIETTANWTTTRAGVTSSPSASQFVQWDQAASTPIDDVDTWKRVLRLLTGYEPNTLILPETIVLALKKNAQVIDRITPMFQAVDKGPVQVTVERLKAVFDIQNILVPKAVYNSAKEGQTAVLTDVWAQKQLWLGYVAAAPGMEEPSAGYQFAWTGSTTDGLPQGIGSGAGPNNFGSVENEEGLFMRDFPDLRTATNILEAMLWASPNVVAADVGMTATAVVA